MDNRRAVLEHARWFEDWRARSQRVRTLQGATLDERFAPAPRACFDWLPAATPGRPTVVFVHGGYWQFNSKDEFAFVAEGLLRHDINVALLGYSLAPACGLRGIASEIAAGLRILSGSLLRFGAAPRLVLAGWSAGAHLAALQLGSPEVSGALLISGIYDLAPVQRSNLNNALRLTDAEVRELSPARHRPRDPPPIVLSYGDLELPELQRQTEELAATWSDAGANLEVEVVPTAHHYSVLESLARPDGVLLARILQLLAEPTWS